MKKVLFFSYGLMSYTLFNLTLLYFIGFIGNFLVPKTIDSGPASVHAVFIDISLILLFGLQHSVMARPAFKKSGLVRIPLPIERSTYVLFSCVALGLLCWLWQPLPARLWQVEDGWGYFIWMGLFWFGWLFSLYATFLVDHFDLVGLRQVYLYLRGIHYTSVPFKAKSFYQYIRHPIMLGTLIGLWATPTMSVGHLLLSLGFSIYIFIGIRLEEKDLSDVHGEDYARYRQKTSMIMPRFRKS